MKTILQQLFLPYLSEVGLRPAEESCPFKRCGLCYTPDPGIGAGYIWVYPVDNLYAVTVYDVVFKEAVSFEYRHPAFLSIGSYGAPIAKLMYDGTDSREESLLGYVGHEAVYGQTVQKNVPLCCVGISLLPAFYENYLPDRFSQDFRKLPDVVSRLKGGDTIPEVAVALKQTGASRPAGSIAAVYYEGKVLEIVSLLMQWAKNQAMFPSGARIPEWESERIHEVAAYIGRNYAGQIPLNALARLACMSRNKLTHIFRQAYGMTITEYIQTLRMEKAKELLLNSNRSMEEIANAVGYGLQGSFSEAFKKSTGFTPKAFRKQIF